MSRRLLLWLSGLQAAMLLLALIIDSLRPEHMFSITTILILSFGIAVVFGYAIYANRIVVSKSQPKPKEAITPKSSAMEFKTPLEANALDIFRLLEIVRLFIMIICLVGFCYFALYRAIIEPLLQYFHVMAS